MPSNWINASSAVSSLPELLDCNRVRAPLSGADWILHEENRRANPQRKFQNFLQDGSLFQRKFNAAAGPGALLPLHPASKYDRTMVKPVTKRHRLTAYARSSHLIPVLCPALKRESIHL
jgi:hypothetical protein